MLTLYTAVGKLQIRKNSAGKEYPLVMVGEKERTLTPVSYTHLTLPTILRV